MDSSAGIEAGQPTGARERDYRVVNDVGSRVRACVNPFGREVICMYACMRNIVYAKKNIASFSPHGREPKEPRTSELPLLLFVVRASLARNKGC